MGFFKNLLPSFIFSPINEIKRDYFGQPKKTYAGEGEDLILEKLLSGQNKGFYVDVGCYHPIVGSNTHKFYKKGWTGVNIDPDPTTIKKFNKFRKGDINLNCGISEDGRALTYYSFKESAINSFSEEFYQDRLNAGAEFLGKEMIKTITLKEVFDSYLNGQTIDFLDIDAEGLDVEVLKSNDWSKYKPRIILVEDQNMEANSFEDLDTFKFLSPLGYKLIAKTYSTAFFSLK